MDGTCTTPACPDCRRWQKRVEGLEAEVRELKRQLGEATRERKRQAAPFRRQQRVAAPKKPGRKAGHAPAHRRIPKHIDHVIPVPVEACPDCHTPLVDKQVQPQYQTDIPPVKPVVTQFNVESGFCPCCRKRVQGRHADQTSDALGAAGNQLGPRLLALGTEMKYRLGVPFRKVADFLGRWGDVSLAPSTLTRFAARLADKARPTYQGLIQELRRDGILHGDNTGWRIGRDNACLWTFASQRTTIFGVRKSWGSDVVDEFLADYLGILCCDGSSVFDSDKYFTIRCNAHPLRRIRRLIETATGVDLCHLTELNTLWTGALDLRRRQAELTERGYLRRASEYVNRFYGWLDFHGRRPGEELRKLANHLDDYRYEWLLHMFDEALPTTNNLAERRLRFAVLLRKIGCCNKTERGAATFGVLASILATLTHRGRDFAAFVQRLLRAPQPKRILLQTLPAP